MLMDIVEGLSKLTTKTIEVNEDLLILDFRIVNACMIGKEQAEDWFLVDAGLENSYDYIKEIAEDRFGKDNKPKAIILTHGHFDHIGSLLELAHLWNVPVYAHQLEIPYITGEEDYPEGDPTVDEGLVAKMSPYFPHESINIGYQADALPMDGSIPGLPKWQWVHTPGHTPGHISLFREEDGVLIAGDAFTTTKQESLLSVLTQREDIKGPPAYLTTDWEAAEQSVKVLRDLEPSFVIPSHGLPMEGEELTEHLQFLVNNFHEEAVPREGKFL